MTLVAGSNIDFLDNATAINVPDPVNDQDAANRRTVFPGGGGSSPNTVWFFDNITTIADPGSGDFRLDNAVLGSVTNLVINTTTANGINFAPLFTAITEGDYIYIEQVKDATKAALLRVSGSPVNNTTFYTIPVTVSDSNTLFDDTAECSISLAANPAPTGGGSSVQLEWKFDSATGASNPGNGFFRYDNSTPSLVTNLFISETTENDADISTLFGLLDIGDTIYVQQIKVGSRYGIFQINAAPTDNGAWWTIPVTHLDSGSAPEDGEECGIILAVGGGVGDNLGNHTATIDLDMNSNNITDVPTISSPVGSLLTLNGAAGAFVNGLGSNITLNTVLGGVNVGVLLNTAAASNTIYALGGADFAGTIYSNLSHNIVFGGVADFQINSSAGADGQVFTTQGGGLPPVWEYPYNPEAYAETNDTTDLAIDYSNLTATRVQFNGTTFSNTPLFTWDAVNWQWTTGFTGQIKLEISLYMTSNTARSHTAAILERDRSAVITSRFINATYIRTANGTNEDGISGFAYFDCQPGDIFYVNLQQVGTAGAATTLFDIGTFNITRIG